MTFLEVVIVLAILSALVGMTAPVAFRRVQAARVARAEAELERLAAALEDHWYERAAFPPSLASLVPDYLAAGVNGGGLLDEWSGEPYVYELEASPGARAARLRSRGPNRIDEGGRGDDLELGVSASRAARRRTAEELASIRVAVTRHLAAGGDLAGTWTGVDRVRVGLPEAYDRDGWGNPYAEARADAEPAGGPRPPAAGVVYSPGPDEIDDLGGGDDLLM
jgi:type II secretory pathway pseudopilin PulG